MSLRPSTNRASYHLSASRSLAGTTCSGSNILGLSRGEDGIGQRPALRAPARHEQRARQHGSWQGSGVGDRARIAVVEAVEGDLIERDLGCACEVVEGVSHGRWELGDVDGWGGDGARPLVDGGPRRSLCSPAATQRLDAADHVAHRKLLLVHPPGELLQHRRVHARPPRVGAKLAARWRTHQARRCPGQRRVDVRPLHSAQSRRACPRRKTKGGRAMNAPPWRPELVPLGESRLQRTLALEPRECIERPSTLRPPLAPPRRGVRASPPRAAPSSRPLGAISGPLAEVSRPLGAFSRPLRAELSTPPRLLSTPPRSRETPPRALATASPRSREPNARARDPRRRARDLA